jgi:uncharacterized membrane protein
MQSIIDSPWRSLGAGLAVAAAVLIGWLIAAGADAFGFASFLIRLLHVLGAIVWIGLVVFVNFVQLVAMRQGDDQTRAVLHAHVVPKVALWFRHASTVTIASGALLTVMAGYALPGLLYGTGVYVPPARASMLWLGALGALVMWMFVHMYIWPNIQVVLGLRHGDADAKLQARARVVTFARLNLVLAVPVTLAMVAAAHLY